MSQPLTKPVWPKATTCVTTADCKYHSATPLPLLYFGVTKSRHSGRARNHKASEAGHIMVLHFLASTSTSLAYIFHPCFCQRPMIKCARSDLYSSIVPLRHFHFTRPPHHHHHHLFLPCFLLHPTFLRHHASLSHRRSSGEMHFLDTMEW